MEWKKMKRKLLLKLLSLLRKKQTFTTEPEKWNELWNLWVQGKVETPYRELMTYMSEVFNGGHDQYFVNLENIGGQEKNMAALKTILPVKHRFILWLAHKAYRTNEKKESAVALMVGNWCDTLFDFDEAVYNEILERYADERIEL